MNSIYKLLPFIEKTKFIKTDNQTGKAQNLN